MNSNLCLAQAQYLFYKKACDAGMKPMVLAKISAQTSKYFQLAFESNQINISLRGFEGGKFCNIMGYHAGYFDAMAWWQLASADYAAADKAAKGMGRAVTYLKIAAAKMEKVKPFVNCL